MQFLNLFDTFGTWLTQRLPERFFDALPKLLTTIVSTVLIIVIGFWLGNLARKLLIRFLERKNVDHTVHYFLGRFLSVMIKTVFVIMALSQLGFNVNSFLAALGAAGVTAGLGLKDCVSQFASGIQILVNKPFKSGDYIEVEGLTGTVDSIHFMNTVMITIDNKRITIPNDHLTTNGIINYTAQENRRIDLEFSIGYKEDISKAKAVLYRTARDNPNVLDEPPTYVAVNEHAASSIQLVCQVWCKSTNYWPTFYTMQEDVKQAFDRNGIEIPYTQMDVHLKTEENG